MPNLIICFTLQMYIVHVHVPKKITGKSLVKLTVSIGFRTNDTKFVEKNLYPKKIWQFKASVS